MTDDSDLPPTRELSWIPLAGAFAVVVLIVVLTLSLSQGENRGAPNAPRVDAKNALLCPPAYQFDPTHTWVPNNAIGVDVATSLVPDEAPDHVVVCRYAAPTSPAAAELPIQGRVVLGGDLDKVRATLVAAKTRLGHTLQGINISTVGSAVYLIGITYPEGTLWVSVGTPVDGNGTRATTEKLDTVVAAAYADKRWP